MITYLTISCRGQEPHHQKLPLLMAAPPRFLGSSTMPIQITTIVNHLPRTAGLSYSSTSDRHVLIWWSNTSTSHPTSLAAQIIQLTCHAGNYYAPVALSTTVTLTHTEFLGLFARARGLPDRRWYPAVGLKHGICGRTSQEALDDSVREVHLVNRWPENYLPTPPHYRN